SGDARARGPPGRGRRRGAPAPGDASRRGGGGRRLPPPGRDDPRRGRRAARLLPAPGGLPPRAGPGTLGPRGAERMNLDTTPLSWNACLSAFRLDRWMMGELAAAEAEHVGTHVSACAMCSTAVAGLRGGRGGGRRPGGPPGPPPPPAPGRARPPPPPPPQALRRRGRRRDGAGRLAPARAPQRAAVLGAAAEGTWARLHHVRAARSGGAPGGS